MASRGGQAYRFVFRGKRGFTKLRYAITYEVWRGRKRILAPRAFPASFKKVSERKSLLEKIVETYELKRLQLNERKRLKRKELHRRKDQKRAKAQLAKEEKQYTKRSLFYFKEAKQGLPVFPKAYEGEPIAIKNKTVLDTTIIPIEPEGERYTTELVEKIIHSSIEGRSTYSIYNFSFREEYLIPLDVHTMRESFIEFITQTFPHIHMFYQATKKSTDGYIFRIKFSWNPAGGDEYWSQGISLTRRDIENDARLRKTVLDTFALFMGKSVVKGNHVKVFVKNYLADASLIYINGFTFESMVEY